MNLRTLTDLLKAATLTGAEQALASAGALEEQLSPSEANRRYGRTQIVRWRQEGLIALRPATAHSRKKVFDRQELEAVAAASNRATYRQVADR